MTALATTDVGIAFLNAMHAIATAYTPTSSNPPPACSARQILSMESGSEVKQKSAATWTTSPISPASSARLASRTAGKCIVHIPSTRNVPVASAARRISSKSFAFTAIGFSTTIALFPAAISPRTSLLCEGWRLETYTTSTSGSRPSAS